MVRAVILPSQLPKSKMSSWSDMLSCHVHFLKYNVVMVNSIILLSQVFEIMKSSRWEMLSCQVNIYCENVAIFVILCRHVMKIIWLSRQVEWHLYAFIVTMVTHSAWMLDVYLRRVYTKHGVVDMPGGGRILNLKLDIIFVKIKKTRN